MHAILQILDEATDSAGPDLISLADLKLALGISDTSEDVELQAAITFQSQLIADYCNRRFGRAEVLEMFTFDPGEFLPARQALVLSHNPVLSIAEVSTLGTEGFQFDPASGRVWSTGTWSDTIEVVYTGGYDLPEEAPARLQKAVIEAVREGRTSGTRDPSIREVQHGDVRVSFFTSTTSSASAGYLSAPVIDLISKYKRRYVA